MDDAAMKNKTCFLQYKLTSQKRQRPFLKDFRNINRENVMSVWNGRYYGKNVSGLAKSHKSVAWGSGEV